MGLLITTTFVISNEYLKWGIIVACGLGVGFIAFKVEEKVMIVVTSMLGAYMIIRGIAMYAGGYPNE